MQVPNRFEDGKRPNRSTVNNLSAGVNSALLHVFDSNTRKYFLVDTGSELSILPPNLILPPDLAKATRPNNQLLIAANGTPIKSFGTRQIELQLGPNNQPSSTASCQCHEAKQPTLPHCQLYLVIQTNNPSSTSESCPPKMQRVPDRSSYVVTVTSNGRISRPPRRYLEVSA